MHVCVVERTCKKVASHSYKGGVQMSLYDVIYKGHQLRRVVPFTEYNELQSNRICHQEKMHSLFAYKAVFEV